MVRFYSSFPDVGTHIIYRDAILNERFSVAPSLSFRLTRRRVNADFPDVALSLDSPFSYAEIQQQQQQKRSPTKPRPPKVREDYESSGGDSEDDYVQARPAIAKTKKRSSSRRKSGAAAEDGEPKTQRKRKRKQPVEIDLTDLPPEQGEFSLCTCFSVPTWFPSEKNPPGYENR